MANAGRQEQGPCIVRQQEQGAEFGSQRQMEVKHTVQGLGYIDKATRSSRDMKVELNMHIVKIYYSMGTLKEYS